jgi:hypothetical protein
MITVMTIESLADLSGIARRANVLILTKMSFGYCHSS